MNLPFNLQYVFQSRFTGIFEQFEPENGPYRAFRRLYRACLLSKDFANFRRTFPETKRKVIFERLTNGHLSK